MNTNRNEPLTIEDVLDAVVLQESEPSYEALNRWCIRFPEHKEALSQFFAAWAVQKASDDRPEIDESLVGSRMVSHALNILHQRAASITKARAPAAEDRLHKMVSAAGLSEDAVMSECQLDESLFAKLDRHLIVFETIPRICFEKLSQAIRCKLHDIMRAIQGPPVLLTSYKSKAKPAPKQEGFLDAVSTSDLSDEMKNEWQQAALAEQSKK
jgi:hypothetical protein